MLEARPAAISRSVDGDALLSGDERWWNSCERGRRMGMRCFVNGPSQTIFRGQDAGSLEELIAVGPQSVDGRGSATCSRSLS